MHITIIDNDTLHLGELKYLLRGHTLNIFSYNEPYHLSDCDLIILSWGAHYSIFNRNNPYEQELQLIQDCDTPIIWICLGAQLIAQAFDSKFGRLSKKLKANITITNVTTKERFLVHEAHRFFITTLGDELEWICSSSYWRELFKHKSKSIYWLQFHPEYISSPTDGKKIFEEILEWIRLKNSLF